MTRMITTAYKGIQVPSLRSNVSDATRRAVWGTWTPEADDNAAEQHLADRERESYEADLLDLVPVEAPPAAERMATEGQQRFMRNLAAERGIDLDARTVLFRDVDATLARLKSAPKAGPAAPVKLEDGIYLLDGSIYKVQHAVHGSSQQYAKLLVVPEIKGQAAGWAYTPGAVTKLTPAHKMTIEQAKEFGALYGVCVRCGRVLTDEDSIERMMGKTCASKW